MDAAAAKKRFLRLWQGLQLYDGLSANDAAAAAVPLSQQPPEVAAPLPELLTGEVAPPDGAPPAHEALRRVCAAGAAAEAADVERSLAVLDDLGALAVAFRRGGAEGAGPSVTDPNVDTGAVEAYFHALAARDARASGEADGGAGATGEGGTPQQAKSLVSQALHRLGNLFTKIGHANDQARKFDSDRAAVHGGLAGGVPSSLSGSREAGPVTIPPSPTPLTKEAFRDCSCVGWELPAEPSFRAHVTRFRERREKLKQELAAAAASATGPETQPRLEEPAYNPAECLVGLRVLLIPLAFPFFEESDHYEALGRILRAYRGLSEAQRERLGRWIAGGVLSGTFPFRVLEGQLQWLQQLVTIRFCTDFEEGAEQFGWDFFCTRTSQPVKNALACMDLFFRANRVLQAKHRAFKREERLRGTAAVLQSLGDSAAPPYLKRIDFVNDALNEHDRVLKHDYECSLYLPRLKWNELVQEFRGARMRGLPAQPPPRRPRVPTAMAEVQAGSALNTMSFGLLEYAWALDPSGKCRLLMLNMKDQQRDNVRQEMLTQVFRGHGRVNPYLTLCVRRDNLIQDALQRLASVSPSGLKRTLKVVFEGEQGVDEGGVQKEFFQLLLEQLYDPNFGMFTYNADNKTYWFSHTSLETNLNFELFGVLLGLAIYNRVIIDVRFPIAVYRKLLVADEAGIARFTVDDLGAVAPELARSLEKMLEFEGDVEAAFCRDYVATYEAFGATVEVPLTKDGSRVPLTNANRHEFVEDYVDWYFNTSIADHFKSFKRGFLRCLQVDGEGGSGDAHLNMFLLMFEAEELELLICGSPVLDFTAWQGNTAYEGYSQKSDVVQWFWSIVMEEFSEEARRELLAFATGSARAPPKGLGSREARFVIARAGPDSEQLPTAHTCFNHLLVPEYDSREKLGKKLRLAISNNQGFGLI